MRAEPATEKTIAARRKLARKQPTTGLPELAKELMAFGWRTDHALPADRIPYFEEAAEIYRGLAVSNTEEHLPAAVRAISSLALQYSLAHDDGRSLTAKAEAAALARQLNQKHAGTRKETQALGELAHGLAETSQFAAAVTAQLEVVDIYRAMQSPDAYVWPDNFMWALLDLAIYLDLAGRTEASMEIDREVLDLERRKSENEPRRLSELAIWTAGLSLRFANARHTKEAQQLRGDAIAVCDRLPAEAGCSNFGFLQALQAAIFARSGTPAEPTDVDPVDAIGTKTLRPVLGVSFHRWSFSVRDAFGSGHEAIDNAVSALGAPSVLDPASLDELGILTRRRNIRQSVRFNKVPRHFVEQVIPALEESVAIERQLLNTASSHGPRRLIQALTDQAIGYIVTGSNLLAGDALRKARELAATTHNNSN